MDLLCTETVAETTGPHLSKSHSSTMVERKLNTALEDPVILEDRCLQNLLTSEERYTNICSYLNDYKSDITAQMRYIVADWMLQVCEEQGCQEEVYSLAMNYMDRFLCVCSIQRTQLQLLGSACLLLASKLREPSSRGLPPDVLVFYTENSITLRDLIQWELLVLAKLKWDVSVVTPQDFLGQLLSRLALRGADYSMVLRHAQAFIAVSARDHGFSQYTPSTICAASIVEALSGMEWFTRCGLSMSKFIDSLHTIIGVEQDFIHSCWERINRLMVECTANQSQNPSSATSGSSTTQKHYTSGESDSNDSQSNRPEHHSERAPGTGQQRQENKSTSTRKQTTSVTPTDVRDVHF